MSFPIPNLNTQNGRTTYVDAEVINLGGSDFTPSKAPQTSALMIGTAGSVKVDTANGSIAVLIPVPVGEFRIAATKVYATANGTTASGITALY